MSYSNEKLFHSLSQVLPSEICVNLRKYIKTICCYNYLKYSNSYCFNCHGRLCGRDECEYKVSGHWERLCSHCYTTYEHEKFTCSYCKRSKIYTYVCKDCNIR